MNNSGANADVGFDAKLSMKVMRTDGTVENYETEWSSMGEEEKERLLKAPSFREWLRKQVQRQYSKEGGE